MAATKKPASVSVSFDPKTATPKSLNEVVAHVLGLAGCPACGRLSLLQFDFVTNPGDTKIPGVINIQTKE
jgi:hypothetical protein